MAIRRDKTNYLIQSVAHALDVMEQFFGDVDELGVTELSKRLKLHKNNVFRLLATLEAERRSFHRHCMVVFGRRWCAPQQQDEWNGGNREGIIISFGSYR